MHVTWPPAVDTWRDVLAAAVAHALVRALCGVAGLGQSAESRAFLFARVCSAYAPGGDVLAWAPPPRARALLAQFMKASKTHGLASRFVRQMLPILEGARVRPLVVLDAARGKPRATDAVPAFWLFLVHWASQAAANTARTIFLEFQALFPDAWAAHKDATVPLVAADGQPAGTIPVPVMTSSRGTARRSASGAGWRSRISNGCCTCGCRTWMR